MSTIPARTVLVASLCLSACGEAAESNASAPSTADAPSRSTTATSGQRESEPTPAGQSAAMARPAAPSMPRAVDADAGAPASTARAGAAAAGGGGALQLAAGSGGSTAATMPAAGSGGSAGALSSTAGSGGMPMLGQDCMRDPLANEAPYGSGFFQQFRGLMGCTAALDLTLYRKMLPAKFEMPADPQVCFYALDFMISGVGPYHEAALLLPIEYAGISGKYVLSMPLDNAAATSGGRAVGFPKYMSDVTITQHGNDWSANVGDALKDLEVEYTGECVAEDVFLWPDFINLTPIPAGETSSKAFLPPRDGRALMVPAEQLTEPKFYSLRGRVQLSIGDHLPWNGLIDETKPFTGYLTTFKGGIDLGNRPLD